MKVLIIFLLLFCTVSRAQTDLIAITYNGRIEYYWVLYTSTNGQHTKVTNYHSAISFYVDTKYLNSITIARPYQRQYRVVRSLR